MNIYISVVYSSCYDSSARARGDEVYGVWSVLQRGLRFDLPHNHYLIMIMIPTLNLGVNCSSFLALFNGLILRIYVYFIVQGFSLRRKTTSYYSKHEGYPHRYLSFSLYLFYTISSYKQTSIFCAIIS